ncbi:hypothetical protein I302_108703 [Kwoniella bestiolae CBS 10118]|uniref:BTB domain-containing protein n=1 Tax=Kwoniella bestiolae CBS 10118 TaxID=1296100 RepID=A0A1B9FTU6_9TREE|nr:hypothetical protein I302_07839 [Kwoniella bestiolae CBS 10118]OCF22194.1 hypothetical protein I302_07839 [Kwoniella bestiolae CBS 10118]
MTTQEERRIERKAGGGTTHPFFPPLNDKHTSACILSSSDHVFYHIPISQAKDLSPTIHNLITKTPIRGDTGNWTSLEASSDTITLVLTVLLRPHLLTNPKSPTNPQSLLKLLPDALIFTRQYGITHFHSRCTKLLISLNSSPLILYTAFALVDDHPSCQRYSNLFIRSQYLDYLPPIVTRILSTHSPKYLNALLALHATWSKAYDELYQALVSDLAGVNIQLSGFGSTCKKRFGRGCPGYISSKGQFKDLRVRAADATAATARDHGYRCMNARIEASIHDEVGCETCSHRFVNAFGAVMSRVFEGIREGI